MLAQSRLLQANSIFVLELLDGQRYKKKLGGVKQINRLIMEERKALKRERMSLTKSAVPILNPFSENESALIS